MGRTALTGPITDYIAGELRAQKARHREWTTDYLAEVSGVPKSTVGRALQGRSAIAVESLVPLCQAMGLDAGALLREAAARAAKLAE